MTYNNVDYNIVNLNEYRKKQSSSVLLWQNSIFQSLDYPEEIQISPNALYHAEKLIEFLPIEIKEPSVGVEPDGEILLEWYKKEISGKATIFSIVFDGKGIIFSLFKDGSRTKNYGHLNFCDANMQKIIPDINENFKTIQNDPKRITG